MAWAEPYLDWTFQSNFDIIRDFGRISSNINFLRQETLSDIVIKTNWAYSDKVYKSYVQNFALAVNRLIDTFALKIPAITVGAKFDYVILLNLETAINQIGKYLNGARPISLCADDNLFLTDWSV